MWPAIRWADGWPRRWPRGIPIVCAPPRSWAVATSRTEWEKAITTVERDLSRLDVEPPRLFYACEILRYLPNHELQNDEIVSGWLALIGDEAPPTNPGRLGQYEACLAWSLDLERTRAWSDDHRSVSRAGVRARHRLAARARREAAAVIPGARFVEIPDASHLGIFTHADAVATALVDFFGQTPLSNR